MPSPRRTIVVAACAAAATVAAVAALVAVGGPSVPTVVGHASDRFPSATLRDWVSYADQVSVVTVTGESALPRPPAEIRRGEGYVGRVVTLRVGRTIWRRDGAPRATGAIDVVTEGWVVAERERYPFATSGGPRLEVGRSYLAPLLRVDGDAWTPLSTGATLPLDGAEVTMEGVVDHPAELAASLRGDSVTDVARALARTRADHLALRYDHLDADQRYRAVLRHRADAD